jgi:hypothetical protein
MGMTETVDVWCPDPWSTSARRTLTEPKATIVNLAAHVEPGRTA